MTRLLPTCNERTQWFLSCCLTIQSVLRSLSSLPLANVWLTCPTLFRQNYYNWCSRRDGMQSRLSHILDRSLAIQSVAVSVLESIIAGVPLIEMRTFQGTSVLWNRRTHGMFCMAKHTILVPQDRLSKFRFFASELICGHCEDSLLYTVPGFHVLLHWR